MGKRNPGGSKPAEPHTSKVLRKESNGRDRSPERDHAPKRRTNRGHQDPKATTTKLGNVSGTQVAL